MIPLDSNAQLSESSVSWDDHRSGELFPVDKVMNELLRDLAPALTGTLHYELVTFKNITELRNINAILFPMSYQDRYYKEVLAPDSLARLGRSLSMVTEVIYTV